jgi:hypothetical protein
VFAVDSLEQGSYPGRYDEYLLNTGQRCGPRHTVRALAESAVRMSCAVRMNVCQLYGGAEEKKDRAEGYKQNASLYN